MPTTATNDGSSTLSKWEVDFDEKTQLTYDPSWLKTIRYDNPYED